MIPFDMLDVADNGDIIDGINDGVDIPEVTDDIDSLETETPENETPENPETKTDEDPESASTDVPNTESGQNVHKTETEDPDLVLNPFTRAKEQWKENFGSGGGKGSCNICRDDEFSCKGGYKGVHKVGAKCENCNHLYEHHQW